MTRRRALRLSLLGALCLTFSTEVLTEMVALPEPLATIAHWRWPAGR